MSSNFTMVCPKCGGTDYSIEQEGRGWFGTGGTTSLVFSCRCGKQIYGDQIVAEHDRQEKAFKADRDARLADEAERRARAEAKEREEAAVREALAYRARILEEKRRVEAEEARLRREAEERRWRERVERAQREEGGTRRRAPSAPKSAPAEPERAEAGNEERPEWMCAWHECDQPARKNSKYCCRACSNRNARWRHKQRKHTDGDGREEAA